MGAEGADSVILDWGVSCVDLNSSDSLVPVSEQSGFQGSSSNCDEESDEGNSFLASLGGLAHLVGPPEPPDTVDTSGWKTVATVSLK